MIRIFLTPEQLASDKIVITGDQARHLSLVLRASPGDSVTILDGNGFKYNCKILQCHKKEVTAECISKEPYSTESPLSITLAQGLPKGDKMDYIVQKSTELGVSKIIPLITERSQIRHTHKIDRWRKIALSAAQQSGRDKIPDIAEPLEFIKFVNGQSPTTRSESGVECHGIIFSEEHKERNLREVLLRLKKTPDITLIVGPEGGLSKNEVTHASEHGYIQTSIGPRILRTETAPLTAISIIQYELGDVG